jgi:Tn3 transposase DDE domain
VPPPYAPHPKLEGPKVLPGYGSRKIRAHNELFKGNVDWELIQAMLPETLRVAVSFKTGVLLPSDILRRMNSHSRKTGFTSPFENWAEWCGPCSCCGTSPIWSCGT